MNANSILIKSITGKIYKITDLIKGVKRPLEPSELAQYNMHPQSGILKDTNNNLIDLVELMTSSDKVKILKEGKPENPLTNAIYVDKSAQSISVFDDNSGEWVELGSSDIDTTEVFSIENALSDNDVKEVVDIFSAYLIKEGEIKK